MNTRTLALACSVCTLGPVASASAQSGPISPVHFAVVEAPTAMAVPLAYPQPLVRCLQIHDDLPVRPRQVHAIAFRRDATDFVNPPFTVELDLTLSTAARSSAQPSATFALNHGTNPSLVVGRRIVQFPGTTNPRALPARFDYVIPFDAPHSIGSAVCWEMRVFGHSATSARFDAVDAATGDADPFPAVLPFGTGCRATGWGVPMEAAGAFAGSWASRQFSVQFAGNNGPLNAPHVAAIGFTNLQWGQTPLPFLLPGTASGVSGPCFVLNDIVETLPGTSNAVGTFVANSLWIQVDPSQHGLTTFHQVLAVDPGANGLGIVSSNSLARQIVAPYARPSVARVTRLGDHAATGTVSLGSGVVTRFLE